MKDVDRMIAAGRSKKEVKRQISKEFAVSKSFVHNLCSQKARGKVEQLVKTTNQGEGGLRPPGSHLGFCTMASSRSFRDTSQELHGIGKKVCCAETRQENPVR